MLNLYMVESDVTEKVQATLSKGTCASSACICFCVYDAFGFHCFQWYKTH